MASELDKLLNLTISHYEYGGLKFLLNHHYVSDDK